MRSSSLRQRLLGTLLLPITLGILLVGASACYSTYHEAIEVYDAEQVHFAKVLMTLAEEIKAPGTVHIEGPKRPDAYEKYLTFRIWKGDGLLLQSDNAALLGPVTQTEGFADRIIGDKRWRFYVERQNDMIVEIAEDNEVRLDLVWHIVAGIFLPQVIIVPIVAIIIWLGITWGLVPAERLSELVRRRNVNKLEAIPSADVPRELLPMVAAINDLMQRVTDAVRVEKNFTTYAAHEMRTPIAALKTQTQVILRTKDTNKQKELAGALLVTINRTQRMIEQLLTYARVQHNDVQLAPIMLSPIIEDEIRHAIPRALEKQINVESQIAADAQVLGQEELIRLALANLLDNALKYTQTGGSLAITLTVTGRHTVLSIKDSGPGISIDRRPHVFDSFYRIPGTDAPGAGLGLAIVRWACDAQHITIDVGEGIDGRGVGFTLHFMAS